jgi:AbrB family looped-hinge helix DNA binding protein
MQQLTCKVDNQGRITLPSGWRREHNVKAGSDVTVLVTAEGLEVQTADQSLADARRLVGKYHRPKSAVGLLASERRREAEIERKEAARHGKGI